MSNLSVKPSDVRTLTAVLNALIPADQGFPAAGSEDIQVAFAKDVAADGNQDLVFRLLRALPEDFMSRSPADREEALRGVEADQPAVFGAVLRHVYNAYWSNPAVREVLEQVEGYPARPPLYEGYELEKFDPDVLAVQRERAPFWRKT